VMEEPGSLRGRRPGLEIISHKVQSVKLAISALFAPVIDNVVSEICVDRALKTRIAAEVMCKQIVVPCHTVPSSDRSIPVPVDIQAFAQNAPLDCNSVAQFCSRQDFVRRPAQ